MLVLSRKKDQQLVIGQNIKITILKVKGHSVRIGVEAPSNVKILRRELVDVDHCETGANEDSHQASADTAQCPIDADTDDEFTQRIPDEHRPAWLTLCCCP